MLRVAASWLLLACATEAQTTTSQDFSQSRQVLDESSTELFEEVVVKIGNEDARLWEYQRGDDARDDKLYASASAIKWVSSVVILRLVAEGTLALDDSPAKYLEYWPHQGVTVENLLSFTSGFRGRPFTVPCTSDADTTLEECAQEIAESSFFFAFVPQSTYFYGPAHFHMLAAMAQVATNLPWQDIFETRVSQVLGMTDTRYIIPSASNPLVSGGALISANDMDLFMRAMLQRDSNFLPPELWTAMLQDQTPSDAVQFGYTPVPAEYPFHYGLGVWRECTTAATFDASCEPLAIASTTGATGVHGWVDYENDYYGLIVTNGGVGNGVNVLTFAIEELRGNVLADLAAMSSSNSTSAPGSAPTLAPTTSGGNKPRLGFLLVHEIAQVALEWTRTLTASTMSRFCSLGRTSAA
jgi:CubicO group peptidase (beta-lactamase class C family)